jgi:hypothetical protein
MRDDPVWNDWLNEEDANYCMTKHDHQPQEQQYYSGGLTVASMVLDLLLPLLLISTIYYVSKNNKITNTTIVEF